MQRTILALILSATIAALGFVIGRPPQPADAEPAAIAAEPTTTSTSGADQATTMGTRPSSTTEVSPPQVEVSPTTIDATSTTPAPPTTTTTTISTTATTTPPAKVKPPISASGPAIPATVTYPGGKKELGGYDIIASNADTGVEWWTAPYLGTNLPYTQGSKWVAGDREAYGCAYGFILDPNGEIDGRFAFVRPPDQAYGKVNDRYMGEGERYLDGSVHTAGTREIQDENCTDARSSIDYNGACRPVDERPRIGFFDGQGNVLDIRDYTHTEATSVNFNLHSFNGSRATVIACEDGLVGMIVYYDSMGDGQLAVDFKGTGPYK